MKKFLRKLNVSLAGSQYFINYDIERHLKYLENLPEPRNYFDRSYLQYKCQCYQKSWWVNFRNNFLSLLAFWPFLLYLLFKPSKKKINTNRWENNLAVFIFSSVNNIVPIRLVQKFLNYEEIEFGQTVYLRFLDIKFVIKLFKYCYSPYFIIKCTYKMAMYRAVFEIYNPQAIVCSSEYSFTSSVLTWYCEQNDVAHINVMHGEKLLNIRDTFFKFHECYVWDIHYVELFDQLKADRTQFVIDMPPSLNIEKEEGEVEKFEMTYYLSGETVQELVRIYKVLNEMHIPNKKISIRPHPRYSDTKIIRNIFDGFFIENPKEYSIGKSLNMSKLVVSLYSTVLYQGFRMGKKIVIDDITQKNKYEMLKQLDYIMFNKDHLKLSDLL